MTVGKVEVVVVTDLDIQGGIDKFDHDRIFVNAHPWVNRVLEAVGNLGFHLHEADCEEAPYFRRRLPFVQEFEFIPTSDYYRQMLDELEVIFFIDEEGLDIILKSTVEQEGCVAGWKKCIMTENSLYVSALLNQSLQM